MPNYGTHYERAFESYLHYRGLSYVAIDQARKAVMAGESLKSFDFIAYPRSGPKLLIDVKGRKLSSRHFSAGRLGQNWATQDDITSMGDWEEVFGDDYQSIFVFAYWLYDKPPEEHTGCPSRSPGMKNLNGTVDDHYFYQQRYYAFFIADIVAYKRSMKTRSPKWKTVFVPARSFQQLSEPFERILHPPH
ncbi:MAG: HYExAFE family protein [Phycisphaerae bacterium]|nr:HYExAFE family protein [Phycisphaerae bacterium]